VYAGKAFARVRPKVSLFLVSIRPNAFDLKKQTSDSKSLTMAS
jgi:hypothetical protein